MTVSAKNRNAQRRGAARPEASRSARFDPDWPVELGRGGRRERTDGFLFDMAIHFKGIWSQAKSKAPQGRTHSKTWRSFRAAWRSRSVWSAGALPRFCPAFAATRQASRTVEKVRTPGTRPSQVSEGRASHVPFIFGVPRRDVAGQPGGGRKQGIAGGFPKPVGTAKPRGGRDGV